MPDIVNGRFVLLGTPTRHGGFGDVKKAVDTHADGRMVAIKYLRTLNSGDSLAKLQFDREVSSLNRLQTPRRHPNIVEIIDAGYDEDRARQFIVLEWIEGDLEQLLAAKPWKSWDEFLEDYGAPLADALSYAHLREVQHRDIKPQNVLVDNGIPKLADFGIAKRANIIEMSGMTLINAHTPPYAPPDKGAGAEYTRDVWALAVLFVRSMYGKPLLDYPDVATALEEIDVPSDVRALLRRCVDTDPQARPQNGSVFAAELEVLRKRRAVRVARGQSAVWLTLTNSAVKNLSAGSLQDREVAQQRAALDLADRWFARYQTDSERGETDRGTLLLFGREWRYVLKRDQGNSKFVVVDARMGSADYHARDCAQAAELTGVVDVALRGVTPERAESGARLLVEAVEAHAARVAEAREARERIGEENRYFEDLLELLDAQEEVAQGDRRPLEFRSRSIRGREVDFELTSPLEQDLTGQEWDIRVGRNKRVARGEIVRQGSQRVTLTLARRPRQVPERGHLAPNLGANQAAHDRQVDAVQKIRDGAAVRADLRDLLLVPKRIRVPVAEQPESWIQANLDDDKQSAVAAALGSRDFLLVEGPPGTGKTTFIAETVGQHLAQNPEFNVLIVSQTHVAVDNALERLSPAVGRGVVRLGRPDDPRVAETVQPLLLDQQMRRWASEIKATAARFIKDVGRQYEVDVPRLSRALELRGLGIVLEEIDQINRSIGEGSRLTHDERTSTGVAQLSDRVAAQERLEWLLDRRDERIAALNGEHTDLSPISADPSTLEIELAIDALLGQTSLPPNTLAILRLQGEWLQRVESDRHLASAFLKTARVVAGTCIGFLSHPAVRDLEFDLCILDEASKATATEALVPLARSKRWVLVGDTKQLPPMDEEVLRAPNVLEKRGLDREFVQTTLFDRLTQNTLEGVVHTLARQYRMIAPIGDMISACFYNDELRSPRSSGLVGLDRISKPVLWLDTSNLGSQRFEERGSGTSHLNRVEARLSVERIAVIDKAISNGFIETPGDSRLSVLLMAPYRRQIEELEREVAKLRPTNLDVLVKSVDAVQGRESDLAIFSVTRSNNVGHLGFLSQPYWRRVNVALSRARFGLIIVGDAAFCEAQPGALREVLEYVRLHPEDCELRQADLA